MKRRTFVKSATSAALALSAGPFAGFSSVTKDNPVPLIKNLTLKGFDDEQEESPSIVTDGSGRLWLFTLRRMTYPANSERISAFYFDGASWNETNPVTRNAGQYEAPAAACAKDGKPVVAWTEKKGNDWIIHAAFSGKNGFGNPYTFPVKSGHSINPVLFAPDKNRTWIAWENLHDGKFTIYISKYENDHWADPLIIDKGENSCFDPALAEAKNGDLYLAYGLTNGFHQDIEMAIIDTGSLRVKTFIPVATGGGFKNRVNINAKPALAFDTGDNLWISYESNRNNSRMEDGDNYTGDRCCSILSYQNGKIVEPENSGKWLFTGRNDHKPTFIKDLQGHLFLATHCGGNFTDPYWKYRISWLNPESGWEKPFIFLQTDVKGLLIPPAMAFDTKGSFWLATCLEKTFIDYPPVKNEGIKRSRLSELHVMRFAAPILSNHYKPPAFTATKVKEYLPGEKDISGVSGHPRIKRKKMTVNGETYTLLYGNLHEHSNSSLCWPAGTDGTLHDDYRFGMFSEGYDFVGMTDHAGSTSEIHWRHNLRIADFYNESAEFIAIPAVEWTMQSDPRYDEIEHGAGHYNIVFASTEDAGKFIRDKHEIYSVYTPETAISPQLWKLLDEKQIRCVTIPHHPADKTHPMDWNVTDPKYVTVVEIFQCRGNNEYPGCPRERNLSRHTPTHHREAYVDYALRKKKYKLGFIASGDHNSMGVGVAALWVKEVNRKGIVEALQNRRTFATTGDKMYIDLKVNGAMMGTVSTVNKVPALNFRVTGQYPLKKVEILRNSRVIHQFDMPEGTPEFSQTYFDDRYKEEKDVLYYYVRATQQNNAIAWSSPVWVKTK